MRLCDVSEIFDCPHSTVPDEGEGYPLIRTPNVGKGRLILDNVHKVSKETYDIRNKRTVPHENDIIFAREAPAGNAAVITKGQNVCLGQRTVLIRPNQSAVNPHYLVYYLLAPQQQIKLLGYSHGATVGHVNIPDLAKLPISLPTLALQKRIADIVENYDNLIEINNKRIKALEQIAENLYKEWFVRFRFLGYENAEFENGIPKGWLRGRIDSYYDTTSGGTPSRKNKEFYNNGVIPWVKTGEIKDSIILDTEEHITEFAINKSSAKILPKGCVIMAMYGVNIGMLSYLSKEMSCNQACCAFTDKRNLSSRHYLFHYMKSIRDYLLLIGFGAAQQNLSQDLIKRIRITMPSDEIVKKKKKRINDYYNQIYNLLKQNRNLIKQRDLLLPRLMSGKLEV